MEVMDISDEEVQEEHEIIEDNVDLENENEQIITNEENEDEGKKEPVKPKRIVKNPRVLLNPERLKGPKGLRIIKEVFEPVKFQGKGYEEQDLNTLLKTYEYWCHRLFPKYPFQDCIDKIEKLGTKGPIQTYLKKIRSGLTDDELPSTSDVVQEAGSDDDNVGTNEVTNQIIRDIPIELTEEQLETIRKNREKAELLRQERLKKIQEKADSIITENEVIAEDRTVERVENENGENNMEEEENGTEENNKEIIE